ncbi:MarR family winged helix-turn-helix transcriptional regulator [Rhizomonospora bruguierae]|uniref:MarR family winged helix-turn-helix transcriptional regulator n=1 Tax=Rhizomonospora bruguierae TaxID=1581705 RepID=UPI001BCF7757|nr:MarR family winged helix-turn-helix transcriptional regulator [Micromonospora sp. NBRC 107566]
MELEPLGRQLAAGLARVAVAVHAAGGGAAGLERTLAQQQVLLVLSRRREVYPLTDLAQDLGMTRRDLLAAVSTLVKEGAVQIEPAPSYAPSQVRIRLTESGRRQPPELLNWAADLLAELHNLDEAHQRRLLGVVTGHIRRLQQQGQIPVLKLCVTCRFFDGYRHTGSDSPHHCWLVDRPFGHRELRLRCPEAEPAQNEPAQNEPAPSGPTRGGPTRGGPTAGRA